ncbi:Type I Iterative PKS [Diaporthe eres]|uniref:Type I Iterative PKS n=1 Tax=Diaporthe eres TaxID=83184 RepID=A0ABR1NMV1_DIAER
MRGQVFHDLIPQIIDDVFRNRIQESKLLEACRKASNDAQSIQLVPIIAAGLHRRLESHLGATHSNLVKSPSASQSSQTSPAQSPSEGVAIVGMSGRFPGAESLDEFWTVLEQGVDLCRQIPSDRFDIKAHNKDASEMSTISPYGCFIDRPGMFDARLFNMSPREAASTDPGQRLLLMSTYEALEMAGYTQAPREEERDTKVGTFFGQTIDDWKEYNSAENVDMYYVTGGIRAFSAGRVNYHFKWDGPSYSVDSACSSSLLAIQLACNSLRSGESNVAVAGGSNILTGCNMYEGLSRGSFLSKTGSCKTFDSSADGYCRGEGVGVIVLKRLSDAVANRDPILAVIRSSATNHSAKAVSITHPHIETQERLYRDVLSLGGLEPSEVDYVECHGTGTQAGDGAESTSVYNALCKTPRTQPLVIGSIKPNIGHGEAAAGVSSLIKSIMMLQRNTFLPHVGIKGEINPKLPPFADKYRIATHSPFRRQEGKTRKVMINNFSAAGGNTSIVLEDAALTAGGRSLRDVTDPRTSHVVTVSAKTLASLRGNMERVRDFMAASDSSVSLADVAYTTTARRLHHPMRKAYAVKSADELATKLEKDCIEWDESNSVTQKPPSLVFAFPGQGSSIVGTAKVLHDSSLPFRRILGELDSLCEAQNLPSILPPLLGEPSASNPSPLESQLCMALLEVAMVRLWKSWGVEPSLVIGHSLGEYAALYAAGVISAADVVFLVAKRASLMQEMCSRGTHKMLSLRMSAEDARVALETAGMASLEITCMNGPAATVVAGSEEDLQVFMRQQQTAGVTAVLLDVPYAFHSAQLDPILEAYESSSAGVNFVKPRIPVASSRLGCIVEQNGTFNSSYLSRQAREPVLFSQAVASCQTAQKVDQNTLWLEMGPGSTCVSLVRQSLGTAAANTLSTLDSKKGIWEGISSTLATLYSRGVDINWADFHRDYKNGLSVVRLPHYAFDLKNYWLDYTSRKDRAAAPVDTVVTKQTPQFSSRCWQEIEEENFGASEASVKFISDLNRPELAGMVHGHAVGGISLCPSSVYASMAFSCALYIFQRRDSALGADEVPPMDLSDMEIFSPCVVSTDADQRQVLMVTATQHSPSSPVELVFSTSYDDEETYRQNARCVVHLTSKAAAFTEANKNLYLIQDRAEMLRRKEPEGDVHKLKKKMVYKLFKTVVDYSPRYFGMEDLLLSSDRPESCARLCFDTPAEPENFVHNPFWIDTLAQLGGFSLNVNPPSGQDDVYISHGWQSMRILRRLSDQENYACYVCMQPSEAQPGVWSGDVYVYSGNSVVALCMGLKFKQMRRPLLYNLLGHALPSKLSPSAPPTPPTLSRSPSAAPLSRVNTARSLGTTPFPALETHKSHVGFVDVLGVITEAAGLDASDVADASTEWSNLGIDSLLTITILEELRKLTGMDFASSLFTQYPTVGDLKVYFQSQQVEAKSPVEPEPQPCRPRDTSCSSRARSRSFLPAAVSRLRTSTSVSSSSRLSEADSAIDVGSRSSGSSDSAELLISIIAREVGVSRAEISPWTKFSELGLDSLLTITVLAMFRQEGGINLPSSFFNDHPTPNDVDATLNSAKQSPLTSVASEDFEHSPDPQKEAAPLYRGHAPETAESRYESKPILIQGTPRPDGQALFLLPDGSGSALSYINLPPVTTSASSLPVYALFSPFISDPDAYDLSLPEVAAIMLRTVRNIQPSGPYMIAGWSMGGILAYEAARQLLAAGEAVDMLGLVDSPCPRTLPPLPAPTLDVLDKAGLFSGIDGKSNVSASTRRHFLASVRALEHYTPQEIPDSAALGRVVAVWAKDSVLEGVVDPAKRDAVMSGDEIAGEARDWLLGKRKDFGAAGWDKLTRRGVTAKCIPGNHFSIMSPPLINDVQSALTDVLLQLGHC